MENAIFGVRSGKKMHATKTLIILTNTLRYDFEYLGFDDSDGDEEVKFSYYNLKGHTLNQL